MNAVVRHDPHHIGAYAQIEGMAKTDQAGMTEDQILADFPSLERDDFLAVYAFAADRERRLMTDPAA